MLKWSDFSRTSSSISTQNSWYTINFNLVGETLIDPYIQTFVTGTINIFIIIINNENDEEVKRYLTFFQQMATCSPPSKLKYQSQMMMLLNGYQNSHNENILLATLED